MYAFRVYACIANQDLTEACRAKGYGWQTQRTEQRYDACHCGGWSWQSRGPTSCSMCGDAYPDHSTRAKKRVMLADVPTPKTGAAPATHVAPFVGLSEPLKDILRQVSRELELALGFSLAQALHLGAPPPPEALALTEAGALRAVAPAHAALQNAVSKQAKAERDLDKAIAAVDAAREAPCPPQQMPRPRKSPYRRQTIPPETSGWH